MPGGGGGKGYKKHWVRTHWLAFMVCWVVMFKARAVTGRRNDESKNVRKMSAQRSLGFCLDI